MNIDYDFLKFVAKEMIGPVAFVCAFGLHFLLPKPWNMIIILILFCYCIKELCIASYNILKLRYEFHLRKKEKVWNALKNSD